MGRIFLVDNQGWKQKMSISYDLKMHPLRTSEESGRHYMKVTVDKLNVKVTQSEFNTERRPPQFFVCRTMINMEPSVVGFGDEQLPADYCKAWDALDHEPRKDHYQSTLSIGTETSLAARIQLGAHPNFNVEGSRKTTRTEQRTPISRVVDVAKSDIIGTPCGGFLWDYGIRPQLSETDLELGLHKCGFGFPCSKPPASIEVNVESTLTMARKQPQPPSFFHKRRILGIFVGYRHVKIGLKVHTRWDRSGPALTLGEMDTTHEHCFQTRDGCSAPQQNLEPKRKSFGHDMLNFMETSVAGQKSDQFV